MRTAAGLALGAWLALAGSVSADLVITTNIQSGTANVYPFTPTWTPSTTSLIAGAVPLTTGNGNFNMEQNGGGARDVSSLTAGGSLAIEPMGTPATTSNNYVAGGNNGGLSATYTLPVATLGYDVTNITVYSGWKDAGRDGQAYNISYSTVDNPTVFTVLAIVKYDGPTLPQNTPSAIQLVFTDSAGGAIARNVAQIRFDFSAPNSENGWTGYGAITVDGTPAATRAPQGILTFTENQTNPGEFYPDWAVETENLIAWLMPSTAIGEFGAEASGGVYTLTDMTAGASGVTSGFATCGRNAGTTLIYTLVNSANGSDLTNIVVYSGWGNRNRDGQYYTISYSTVSAPTTFLPLTTVLFNPDIPSDVASANRVAIRKATGAPLAQNVHSVKFDFATMPAFDNSYVGISEIVLQGTNSQPPTAPPAPYLTQDTLPASVVDVVGGQAVFTVGFSNVPPVLYQWQIVSEVATNDIPGATAATLTLNTLQVTDSGLYRVKAVNATNNLGVSYSSASSLTVSNMPAPVNDIITHFAAQTGLGNAVAETNFYPTWTLEGNSLIAGIVAVPGTGNFGLDQTSGDPALLNDGTFGYLNYWPNVGGSSTLVTCGINPAGQSVTYTLDTSTAINGFDLTKIVVYGGWGDGGRDSQKYQVLYSTVADPFTFNQLTSVDFNPPNPRGTQSATRTTVQPAGASLAQNVAAVMINFNLVGGPPENGYEGYSEIFVSGVASAPKPVLSQDIRPLTAADVVGSRLVISAGFTSSSPITYQWRKDGVNIPGANTPTLTLNNLQESDSGAYTLMAANSSGSTVSRACTVTVSPAPEPVGNLVTSVAYQTGDSATFSPSWSVVPGSLIANQPPSSTGTGNFNDPDGNPNSGGQAGGIPVLTDENYGSLVAGGAHPAFATCGPNAGRYVVYTLQGAANGYDLTNIVVAGGWNDSGRDHQAYTVGYSTPGNPTTFIPLAVVNNNPVLAVPANHSVVRTTLAPAAGALATNVYAVMIDFVTPPGENAYSGYSEISLYGSPSAAPPAPGPVVRVENQPTDAPFWTLETSNLIAGQLPSSSGPGNFQTETSGGLVVLTDGSINPLAGTQYFATCGNVANGAGQSVTYTSDSGWNLSRIVVYSGWGNYDRDGQFYNVLYSTTANPETFLPLVSVDYNPENLGGPSANRVEITNSLGGFLASGVAAVKFDFTRQGANDNGYSGYAEIVLQGTLPPYVNPPQIVGGNLLLSGGGNPGDSYSLLSSTDAAAPLATWTTNATGVINASGVMSHTIPVSPSETVRFFRLKTP